MLKAWPFMTLRIFSVTYENWGNKTDIKKQKNSIIMTVITRIWTKTIIKRQEV